LGEFDLLSNMMLKSRNQAKLANIMDLFIDNGDLTKILTIEEESMDRELKIQNVKATRALIQSIDFEINAVHDIRAKTIINLEDQCLSKFEIKWYIK
jgi:hypothetical protein